MQSMSVDGIGRVIELCCVESTVAALELDAAGRALDYVGGPRVGADLYSARLTDGHA